MTKVSAFLGIMSVFVHVLTFVWKDAGSYPTAPIRRLEIDENNIMNGTQRFR